MDPCTFTRAPQDYKEAFKWGSKAAEQIAEAQLNLDPVPQGHGVPQDYKEVSGTPRQEQEMQKPSVTLDLYENGYGAHRTTKRRLSGTPRS